MNKRNFAILVAILVLTMAAPRLGGDDKELFMGFTSGLVKPNVVILADTSGSMNTLIQYPKNGLDNIPGTADDGFDPRVTYPGTLDRVRYYYNYGCRSTEEFNDRGSYWTATNQSTQWYGRWRHNGNAYLYHNDSNYASNCSGSRYINNVGTWTGCYANDGTPNNFQVGTAAVNFNVGERIMYADTTSPYNYAVATLARKYEKDGNHWFELSDIVGGPIVAGEGHFQRAPGQTPVVVRLYSEYDDPKGTNVTTSPTRLDKEYLKWVFIHADAAQIAAVSHHSMYGTFDVSDTSLLGAWSICDKDNYKKPMKRFTRIQVTREVLCHVARNSNTQVMLGLFTFDDNKGVFDYANGGYRMDGLGDRSDEVSLIAYLNNIWGIQGNSNTPLAEALADIWYYIKPGPASKTYWPVDYELENGIINVSNAVSDIDWWCQNNYVVIMTDGESSQDYFNNPKFNGSIFKTKPVKRSANWESWDDGWGDLDSNEADTTDYDGIPLNYNPDTATYCPNWTCWLGGSGGTDYLDDVAYFIRNQDMFPDDWFGDDPVTGWPGDQGIFTYVIGFNADNDMLRETAVNGDGAYYTANNYDELVAAFESVITSILLRNFAFSAITAPKKTASIAADGVSYVGYFMPSAAAPIWEGHLLANRLIERWGFDADEDGQFASDELYATETACQNANPGETCSRVLNLSNTEDWDAAQVLQNRSTDRALFTHSGTSNVAFTQANTAALAPLIGCTQEEAGTIVNKINGKQFGDIFHSDIGFVGPPLLGKVYLQNQNPAECSGDPAGDADCYGYFAAQKSTRTPVIYVGTNDGILHMIDVDDGSELWGFIPDEVLPTLKTIALDNQHDYTVDGRMLAEDIYFRDGNTQAWKTMLYYGLRRGGDVFYAMDVTNVDSQPAFAWKFKDADYSGQSWAKPVTGQLRYMDGENLVQRWVTVLAGGFAPNAEVSADSRGKAVFVVDASTGELLWMAGYNASDGAEDEETTEHLELGSTDDVRYLTKSPLFNFAIPSALTAVDINNDGLLDTIYAGNVGGHLFRIDISSPDRANWRVYPVYEHNITDLASGVIAEITEGNVLKVGKDASSFVAGYSVVGQTSGAHGFVTAVDGAKKTITVEIHSGTFVTGETVKTRDYAPIHLQPAVAYDQCQRLWVTFGTGDRDRPRTNPTGGRYIAIQGRNTAGVALGDLQQLTLSGTDSTELAETTLDLAANQGWYLNFPGAKDKLFDPEPLIIPDLNGVPHIYFNTYTPPGEEVKQTVDNPCVAPQEGAMMLYDIALFCGPDVVEGGREEGRIAGGGIYQGKEFVQYLGTGAVGSVPPLDRVEDKRLPYPGGVIFIKERKR
ncbi:MAG TPA: hypothetical protein ENN40_08005 [Candidatus Aminicenantes bacterium]|nr:hypothetical protein [Candidatus Aminicenantes bacterium]